MRKAIITGINGQDGSYLAELLLSRGYVVHGVVRRSSIENQDKMENISLIRNKLILHTCSLENSLSVYKLFTKVQPDECYHLAASSFVSYSQEDDLSIMTNNFTTTHNILSSVLDICPKCKVYFAGSSEIFGDVDSAPQNENTMPKPRSVYGISKLSGHCIIRNYRNRYNLFVCTGFTYNHESPRRGASFVTRKITMGAAAIALGQQKVLGLGNIEAVRDWGYAPEYVDAMYRMLQAAQPRDYVIATGKLHSVKDLLKIAFDTVGLDYKKHVVVRDEFMRPGETIPLLGDASAIWKDLNWRAEKPFEDIIQEMVHMDLNKLKRSFQR